MSTRAPFQPRWQEKRAQEGYAAIGGIESHTLKDKCQLARGRIQVMVLPHQYLQLTSLVGIA